MILQIGGKRRRQVAAMVLAVLALAICWWRTPVSQGDLADLQLVPLRFEGTASGGLRLTGLWDMRSGDARFGGYSALLLDADGEFLAFSDRGRRLAFGAPGRRPVAGRQVSQQPARGYEQDLFDIESATSDPASGTYWLGYEGVHTVHRFHPNHRPDRHRWLDLDWSQNGGAESLVRLADGRFALLPESEPRLYLFSGDPVTGEVPASVPVVWPEPGYAPTDAVQLPDGRLLVLMRRVVIGLPPGFDSLLVWGALPEPGEDWRPQTMLRLGSLLPRENYEGLALRPLAHGGSELWLIADDNFSAFQRSLLARLVLAPGKTERGHEKAREGRASAR